MRNTDEDYLLFESLKSCAKKKDLDRGIMLHDHVMKKGLLEMCTYIVWHFDQNMYSKCGMLAKAHQIQEEMSPFGRGSYLDMLNMAMAIELSFALKECKEKMDLFPMMSFSLPFSRLVERNHIVFVPCHCGCMCRSQQVGQRSLHTYNN